MSDYICILACLVGVFWKTSQKNISQKTTKLFSVNLSLVTAEDIWRHALRNTNTYTLSWRLKWKVGKNLHIYRRYLLLIYLDNIKKQKKIPSSSTYYTGIKYHISEIFFTFINTTRKTMTGSIIQKKILLIIIIMHILQDILKLSSKAK